MLVQSPVTGKESGTGALCNSSEATRRNTRNRDLEVVLLLPCLRPLLQCLARLHWPYQYLPVRSELLDFIDDRTAPGNPDTSLHTVSASGLTVACIPRFVRQMSEKRPCHTVHGEIQRYSVLRRRTSKPSAPSGTLPRLSLPPLQLPTLKENYRMAPA